MNLTFCPFHCLVDQGSSTRRLSLSFNPDPVKKHSAFWLENPNSDPSTIGIQSPNVTLIIESTQGAFVLGGFQLESNSKMVEVHLQKEETVTKEYLTTCRGVGEPCKAMCAIPGGPRQVWRLYLELKSLQPTDDETTTVRIKSLKLTARIPEALKNESAASASPLPDVSLAHPVTLAPQQALPEFPNASGPSSSFPSLSRDDVSSAMAAVSMMMRATENRIVHAVTHQLSQQQTQYEQQMQQLTRAIMEQRLCIQQQSQLLTMQTTMLQQQTARISELTQGQTIQIATGSNSQQHMNTPDHREQLHNLVEGSSDDETLGEEARDCVGQRTSNGAKTVVNANAFSERQREGSLDTLVRTTDATVPVKDGVEADRVGTIAKEVSSSQSEEVDVLNSNFGEVVDDG
jgi:hypothetical protein